MRLRGSDRPKPTTAAAVAAALNAAAAVALFFPMRRDFTAPRWLAREMAGFHGLDEFEIDASEIGMCGSPGCATSSHFTAQSVPAARTPGLCPAVAR